VIALLGAAAFAAALDVATVRTPYARVRIPVAVDPAPSGNYRDLRVRDERGAEIPYVVETVDDGAALVVTASAAEAVRPPDAPATQVATIELRVPNLEVNAVRFDAATPSFARDVTIEGSEDGVTWSKIATDRISRFRDEAANLQVPTPYGRARWWRATIDNRDDAPLAGVRISLLIRPKDVVFPVVRPHRYRLTFGDPNTDAPTYDLRERLRHEQWRADRGSAGPIVVLGARRRGARVPAGTFARTPSPPALPGWLTSLAFTGAIVVLAAFALRLARAPDAAGPEGG
jgi:hypothetical protein